MDNEINALKEKIGSLENEIKSLKQAINGLITFIKTELLPPDKR